MRADITRSTYRPAKRFSGVRMQQGRVQLDADWNEQLDIQAHLDHTTTLDVVGPCGVPETGGGFEVGLTPGGKDLSLSAGRIYVDGFLCENAAEWVGVTAITNGELTLPNLLVDGAPVSAGQWFEISGQGAIPTPPLAQVDSIDNAGKIKFATLGNYGALMGVTVRRVTTYLTQTDLPNPAHAKAGPPASIDLATGDYAAYLDVWQRGLTAHEDTSLLEKALGGPDTAFRSKTVWQLQIIEIKNPQGPLGCDVQFPDWDALVHRQLGAMAAHGKVPDQQSGDPLCLLPPGSNYNGLENQLYRIEIHTPGQLGTATFKWSRENGSVEARWLSVSGQEIKVDSTGRDSVLGFTGAGAIELVDDSNDLQAAPNQVGLIKGYTVADDTTIVLPQSVNLQNKMPDKTLNPRIRRWENEQEIATGAGWIPLERGVEVQFADGGASYNTGDYWLVSARTASGADIGDVEWPVDPLGVHLFKPPDGVRHHFCRLAVFHTAANTITLGGDCRAEFPSLATIDAEDVAYTGSCAGAGPTVETALDFLCANTQIPDHNLHLHGTGIVCGLQVECVGSTDKRVIVKTGQAIAHDGQVVNFAGQQFDVVTAASTYDNAHQGGPLIVTDTQKGDGEASLYMALDQQNTWALAVEPFDPSKDTPQSRLEGTLLKNIYDDCIKNLQVWLQQQLNDPNNTSPASKADQLKAALVNLSYQVINKNTGQNIFLSLREHKLLLDFYNGLKQELQSNTYCAMFNNARPYPDYTKFAHLQNLGMDTVFGKGTHNRLRLRPGTNDAFTVGAGLNPLKPSMTLNCYDMKAGQLVSVIDPLSGVSLKGNANTSSGADSVRDVAFLNKNQIFVIIPTRDGQNTIIRPGVMAGSDITWGPQSILCGVKLITLATTAADKSHLYAIGQGTGLYKLEVSDLKNITATLVGAGFEAVGHLRMTDDGRAFATAGNAKTGEFKTIETRTVSNQPVPGTINLAFSGFDDVVLDGTNVWATEGRSGNAKAVRPYSMTDGKPAGGVEIYPGGVQLEYMAKTNQVMLAEQADFSLRLVDAKQHTLASPYLLPMQVNPVAIATDGTNVYVLNYLSNTIITITDRGLLDPNFATKPILDDLAAYRAAALNAFADLTGGFAEYLKDCLCDHLLVDCPDPQADPKIYLGTVRIRGSLVDRICNLNKRRYVKSFPTVGYWLSLFPVLPLFKWAIARFCCITIPDTMSKYEASTAGSTSQPGDTGSNPVETLQQWLGTAHGVDLFSFLGNALSSGGVFGQLVQDAFLPPKGQAPDSSPQTIISNQPPAGQVMGGRAIAGQPTATVVGNLKAAGVNVEVTHYKPNPTLFARAVGSYFTDPVPGSTLTLYDQAGIVQAYTVLPQGPSADLHTQVTALTQSVQAKDQQINQLTSQMADLQVQQAQLLATQRQHFEAVSSLQALVSAQAAATSAQAGLAAPQAAAVTLAMPVAAPQVAPEAAPLATPEAAPLATPAAAPLAKPKRRRRSRP